MTPEDRVIYHLTSADYFHGLPAEQPYLPREFERDGFIHCTKGEERMLLVGDTVYRRVPGDFLLLVIDERKLTSPVKYENSGGILFPHIYGPLNRDAVVRVVQMGRRPDGTFLPLGEPDAAADKAVMTAAWFEQARVEQLLAESAELRVRTFERIEQIERAIVALKVPVAPAQTAPAQTVPAQTAPAQTAPAALPQAAPAAAPGPTLEERVKLIEQEIADLKSQISKLKAQRKPTGRAKKTVARRK